MLQRRPAAKEAVTIDGSGLVYNLDSRQKTCSLADALLHAIVKLFALRSMYDRYSSTPQDQDTVETFSEDLYHLSTGLQFVSHFAANLHVRLRVHYPACGTLLEDWCLGSIPAINLNTKYV